MNDNTLYRVALQALNGENFEKVCQIVTKFKWESSDLRFPSSHSGGDGGMDAWNKSTKFAFSINQSWQKKIRDELKKLHDYNSKICPQNPLHTMIYLTNQNIHTKRINDFKQKNQDKIGVVNLKVYAIEELLGIISDIFSSSDNYELYDLLGITGLKIANRKENLYGLHIENENFENNYEKKCTIMDSNFSYNSFQEILISNINNGSHNHYFVTADAGMGKSYEMRRAVYSIAKNNEDNSTKNNVKVFAYYYNLNTYIGQVESPPWLKDKEYISHSDTYYVFLDGWDELSFENQKKIQELIKHSLEKIPGTYFVISGRTGSFSKTDLFDFFSKNYILCYISLHNNEVSLFPKDELLDTRIPFFRKLQEDLGSDSKTNIPIPNLLEKWFLADLQKYKHIESKPSDYRTEAGFKKFLANIGKFAFELFINGDNSFTEKQFYEQFSNDEEKICEDIMRHESWVSKNLDDNLFYFKHKIFQEYLIAMYLYVEYTNIPDIFITGLKKQMIKRQYRNIFFLWLTLLFQDDSKSELQSEALELVKYPENIMLILSCDSSYISDEVRMDIFENIIQKIDDIALDYTDIQKLSIWINSISNKDKAVKIIYDKLNEELDRTSSRISNHARFLLSVLSKIQDLTITKKHRLDVLHKLFQIYIANPNKMRSEFSNINKLILSVDKDFKIDVEFANYCQSKGDTNIKLINDFKVFRIIENFIRDKFDFDKHSKDILSILPYLKGKGLPLAKMGDSTSDDQYTPTISYGNYVRESLALGSFLLRYVETDENPNPEIPQHIIDFSFEVLCELLKKNHTEYPYYSHDNPICNIMQIIYACLKSDLFSEAQYITFREIITPLLSNIDTSWINIINSVIDRTSEEEKKQWLEVFIELIQHNDKTSWIIYNVIFSTIDQTDKEYIESLLQRFNTLIPNHLVYKDLLDIYYQQFQEDALTKWKDKYHEIFDERDARLKEYNSNKQLLKEKQTQAKVENIKALFDRDVFDIDMLQLLELKEKYTVDYFDMIFDGFPYKLEPYNHGSQEYKTTLEILDIFPNQILAKFLWRHWQELTKEYFENTFSDLDWDRVRAMCISEIIGDISLYSIGTIETNSIDEGQESYFNNRNDNHHSTTKDKLKNYIEDVKRLTEETINLDIHYKYNILVWLKLQGITIDIPKESLQLYINTPRLSMYGLPMYNSPFETLEYILGAEEPIVEFCRNSILNYSKEDVEYHSWDFYIAYLRLKLGKNDTTLNNLVKKMQRIIEDMKTSNLNNSQGIQIEYSAFCENFGLDMDILSTDISLSSLETLLQKKETIPEEWKELIKKRFDSSTNNQEKYKYGLFIADYDNIILEWLIEYWLSGGEIPAESYFKFVYPKVLNYQFNLDDSTYEQLCSLLEYACEFEKLSTRRESIFTLSKTWIENSTTTEKQYNILEKIVNTIIKKHSKFNWLKTNWLRIIEEKISPN